MVKHFFGDQDEIKIIKLIIGTKITGDGFIKRDQKFGLSLVRILSSEMFSTSLSRTIVSIIIDYYCQYKNIPWFDEIKVIIKTHHKKESPELLSHLLEIYSTQIGEERKFLQNSISLFFQQQKLGKAIDEVKKIISNGEYDRYPDCVSIIKECFEVNDLEENHLIVEETTEADLKDLPLDYVKLGWGEGIESYLSEGKGLPKGGIYGIFAPSGGGKTTSSVVTLSNAFLEGRTVVQIFFEGTLSDIRKMQFAHWSGLNKNAIKEDNSSLIIHRSNLKIRKGKDNNGVWIIKKFRANHTKFSDIEAYIEKLIEMGYIIDLLSIDYLECIEPKKKYNTDYGGELEVVKDIEWICEHHNIAGIVYFQGNREGQSAKVLGAKHLGGNFKKMQPCHTVITVAMPQSNTTNIAVIKNRYGTSDILFTNCHYDRGNITLDVKLENFYGSISEWEEKNLKS